MFNKLKVAVNLQLFDGEGEGTGGSVNSTASASQSQGDAVVYGKDADTQTSISQNATDNTPNTQEFDFANIPQEKRSDYYKQFKEAFKDEYTNDFNNHFDRRFKSHKETEGKVSQYEPIINALMKYHNVNDIAALQNVIDTDIMADLAEQEGFPNVEKYKEYLEAKKKSEMFDSKAKEEEDEKANQDRINLWMEEGEKLKAKHPEFDLSKEILVPEFAERLSRGLSIEDAYTLTHLNDIVAGAAKKAEENTVTSIKNKGNRIPENGINPTPGIVRKTDPSKLTEKDMAEIRKRVARGEKISF